MKTALAALFAIGAAACTADHQVGSQPSCLFGAHTQSRAAVGDDASERATLVALEADIHRTLDLDRRFRQWDNAVPDDRDRWTLAAGRTPLVSFNGRGATSVLWKDVAAGAQDAHLAQVADGYRALGQRVFCMYHHEPENDTPEFGTADDFRAAFRHVVDVFRERGATNVVWVFNMKSPSFATLPDAYYPGDDHVDWISATAYNFGQDQPGGRWLSLRALLADFHDWAAPRGKPLMVAEWATMEDANQPDRKPEWIAEVADIVSSWPEIRGVSYFDGTPNGGKGYDVGSSPASDAAFRTLAANPIFAARHSVEIVQH